ncbi:MAG: class SAM-dependent methyltransferase [Pedosphaera sp.]|nr:class SAM-dependent methyltransferase [Pedosphaera sp.]
MNRLVEPEWLDELPPHHPDAVRSRQDLRRLNSLMGNLSILSGLLQSSAEVWPSGQIVELGAGDGTFMLRLARRLSHHLKQAHVVLVDAQDAVTHETRAGFAAIGWTVEIVTADVFDWLRQPMSQPADAMIANLFLHHFSGPQLSELMKLATERTRLFAACEPWRSPVALAFSQMLGFIGCNAVTRHDAVVSVRAGFAGRELSSLWPARSQWRLQERSARMFTHAFVAERITPP